MAEGSDEIIIERPLPPISVSRTPNSITISWKKPIARNTDIEDYKISFKEVSKSRFKENTVPCTCSSYEASGLKVNTTYIFKVQAISDDAESEFSEEVAFVTSSDTATNQINPSNRPSQPACYDRESHSITIMWDHPIRHQYPIDEYEIWYSQVLDDRSRSPTWHRVRTREMVGLFNVEGLKENTRYEFFVRAVSTIIEHHIPIEKFSINSEHSEPIKTKTSFASVLLRHDDTQKIKPKHIRRTADNFLTSFVRSPFRDLKQMMHLPPRSLTYLPLFKIKSYRKEEDKVHKIRRVILGIYLFLYLFVYILSKTYQGIYTSQNF